MHSTESIAIFYSQAGQLYQQIWKIQELQFLSDAHDDGGVDAIEGRVVWWLHELEGQLLGGAAKTVDEDDSC